MLRRDGLCGPQEIWEEGKGVYSTRDETEGLDLGDREIEEKVYGLATWFSDRCLTIDLKHGVITNRGAQEKN